MIRIVILLAIVAILALGFFLIADPVLGLDFGLIRVEQTSTTEAVLAEARNVFALSTVEFVYKTVFPHDFVPADMDWGLFLRQRQEGRTFSPLEEGYFRVYELCRDIGVDLQRKNYEFVVITTVVRGGFDLQGSAFAPGGAEALVNEYVRIDESGAALVRLPRTVITDLVIEDSGSADYGYPDTDISPESWRGITTFVAGSVRDRVIDEGILAMAMENGKRFLRALLTEAGIPKVEFLGD